MPASAQVGSMDITRWLVWFLDCLTAAMNQADKTVGAAQSTTRLQPSVLAKDLNEDRQNSSVD